MPNKKNDKKKQGTLKHILLVFSGTFFCATLVSFVTNAAVESITAVSLVFLVLLLVVAVGVFFDAVGVAAIAPVEVEAQSGEAEAAQGAEGGLRILRLPVHHAQVAHLRGQVAGEDAADDAIGRVGGIALAVVGLAVVFVLEVQIGAAADVDFIEHGH